MKNLFLSILLIISYLSVTAQGQRLTLQQCIEIGIANNANVLQGGLDAQTAGINWKQRKLNMLPDLNGQATHGINTGRSIDPFTNTYLNQNSNYASYFLGSSVTIFNGLAMQSLAKRDKFAYESSKMTFQQRKDILTLDIIQAYLRVLNSEDQLAEATKRLELSKKQVDRLEIMDKEGAIPPSQLSDLRGIYAGDQLSIVTGMNALENARIDLCQSMNVPYTKDFSIERLDASVFAQAYTDTPDKIYEVALQQFAQVKAVEYSMQSARQSVKYERGRLFPTLNFNAGIGTNYSNTASSSTFINTTDVTSDDYVIVNGNPTPVIRKQDNFTSQRIAFSDQFKNNRNSGLSLDLRIPIFNSFSQRNLIKLAKINLKGAELTVTNTKTLLQQAIERAYSDMTSYAERHKILEQQVAAYTESFRAAEVRFNAGVGTSIEYLTAKNNLDLASINLIQAKYEYVLRTKILDYYKGMKLW
jgi:outer membrane protein